MNLFLNHQVAELDQLCMRIDQQSSAQLMLKAARTVWGQLLLRWPEVNRILVLAGSGNNGGDAFAVAMLARQQGYEVNCLVKGDLENQSSEARFYRQQWEQLGGVTETWSGQLSGNVDIVVDGLLGIGLSDQLNEDWQQLIHQINAMPVPRVAIDIPTGLNANTGNAMPVAVRADVTVSFIGRKLGCYLCDGPDYCGDIEFDSLGMSDRVTAMVSPVAKTLQPDSMVLPTRDQRNTHKNQFGHVLVVGGGYGMSGAARLAGMAALRCGSGLVSLAVDARNVSICAMANPELMVFDWSEIPRLVEQATVIVVGPGLGRSAQSQAVLSQLHQHAKPMVVDADALQSDFLQQFLNAPAMVLTPHPGEAGRLLDMSATMIQQDRVLVVRQLAQRYQSVSVLKGSSTLISDGDSIHLNRYGNNGLSTAGSGDVLAGMIGSYLGQGLNARDAANTAVIIHALAAEAYACKLHHSGLIASDLVDLIPSIVHQYQARDVGGQT